jgi:hypothetical protein
MRNLGDDGFQVEQLLTKETDDNHSIEHQNNVAENIPKLSSPTKFSWHMFKWCWWATNTMLCWLPILMPAQQSPIPVG